MASTPCAACKLLRRKCTQECVFAPFFPPTQPQKFAYVHRVFGASNVAKILNELPTQHREEAVNSLYYEAEARLRDPIYGCVGLISCLQQGLKKVQQDLIAAKIELANYVGVDAIVPYFPSAGTPPPEFMPSAVVQPLPGPPYAVHQPQGQGVVIREPSRVQLQQQQQPQPQPPPQQQPAGLSDAERLVEMLLSRGENGLYGGMDNMGSVTATGFNQMDLNVAVTGAGAGAGASGGSGGPSLALGGFGDNNYQMNQEGEQGHNNIQLQTQILLPPPEPQDGPEGEFLMQPMAEDEPDQMQELQSQPQPQPQPPIDRGRGGSEEASN